LYNSTVFGAVGSTTYNQVGAMSFSPTPGLQNNEPVGCYRADSTGAYELNSDGTVGQMLTSQGTNTVPMPVLPSIASEEAVSAAYTDTVKTYADGTTNPNYGKGAYVQVYNTTSKKYTTLSTSGYVNGIATLVRTTTNPIKIHGPVTVATDVVIQGYVSGQGSLIAGRNVHVIGSVIYKTPPNFQQATTTALLANAQKADMLALIAEQSIFLGQPDQNPASIMTPPWTKARTDENGNAIPAYDGTVIDSWGTERCLSLLGNSTIDPMCQPVNELDGVYYSNHYFGGTVAKAGGNMVLNGSVVAEDEYFYISPAMTGTFGTWNFSYDPRIKDRGNGLGPVVNLNLPGSPTIQRLAWVRGPFQGA
jgi:hypothetical protein